MKRILLIAALLAWPALADVPGGNRVEGYVNGQPIPISGTVNSAGAADTVGANATFNANSVCATVLLTGQPGAGFFLAAGTLAATLTPSVSEDATPATPGCTGGNWTASKFVTDVNGNTATTLVLTNPNAFQQVGVATLAGSRCARVCTTAFTSGSAVGNLVATVALSPSPAPSADVTDRAGRVLGQLTDGASAIVPAKTGQLPTALDGSGFLKVHEQGTAAISAASLPLPSGAATEATLAKLPVGQGSTTSGQSGVLGQGAVTTAAPTYTTGQTSPVSLQTDGSQRVAVTNTPAVSISGTPNVSVTNTPTVDVTDRSARALGHVDGTVASGATDANNPVKVGGTFNTTQPTVTNGQRVDQQMTARGAAIVATGVDTFNATVSGTVTTTPPANASTNVAQFGGTNVSTGTGAGGAGIPRVTVSNDSTVKVWDGTNTGTVKAGSTLPAATDTAVVVTARDTVTVSGTVTTTPPANASTNVAQVAGTATDTNTGNASAGTQRVVLASNQPTIGVTQGGAGSIFQGQQPLQPYAAATALPANASKTVCFRNLSTSADYIYLGSTASVNQLTGEPFAPGEGDCRNVSNANLLFFATMAGATVAFDGVN